MNNSKPEILIIDDDQLFAEKLKYDLASFSANVIIAHNAENGSHFVSSVKPELIFLDNKLPKLQGSEVLNLYKELSPKSKTILISGQFDMVEVVSAIENKADYILNKSEINNDKLKNTIEELTQEINKKQSLWDLLGSFIQPKKYLFDIAIIEDDELFSLKLTKELNRKLPNYSVNQFLRGGDFFEYCLENSPKLILLDYYLPDYSGSDILNFIRKLLPETKVIIISSQNDSEVTIELFQKGVSGYIVKETGWTDHLEECIKNLEFSH